MHEDIGVAEGVLQDVGADVLPMGLDHVVQRGRRERLRQQALEDRAPDVERV